ncbi:MAG: UDP-N-acetylglucosamine 1-carboxyvinyltransferase [Verrucomicrobiae bacterium]|nr:UDP-N-acetylglucosamine 1-carboxyvinyltransferase [Verrucomicrobiae bacterium]
MDRIVIEGGVPLRGEVVVSGSKNSTLPILAATLMTSEPCVIRHVPDLSDVRFMLDIIRYLGAEVTQPDKNTVRIHAARLQGVAPYDLVRKMRASVCLLGPLVVRLKSCRVSIPGGCVIGPRPIDLHIKGLNALGAGLTLEEGYVVAHAQGLKGTRVGMGGRYGSTVLGTANVMMAACLAEGMTVIENAAIEPELLDLADFLNAMGARVSGHGTATIVVEGTGKLHGADYRVIPDRMEAGTFLAAAAITRGDVLVKQIMPGHVLAVNRVLEEAGFDLTSGPDWVRLRTVGETRAQDVVTNPYPGFPTDMQAQMMALMCVTPGASVFTERVFPDRFMHVSELQRMGAQIEMEGATAVVKGVDHLSAAPVMASDLRASAALMLAGLVARGKTEIRRVYHIDRGYEHIDDKLRALGARIQRVRET